MYWKTLISYELSSIASNLALHQRLSSNVLLDGLDLRFRASDERGAGVGDRLAAVRARNCRRATDDLKACSHSQLQQFASAFAAPFSEDTRLMIVSSIAPL